MSRLKEVAMEEERIKFERADAAFFALPDAQVEALTGIKDLLQSHKDLLDLNETLKKEISKLQAELLNQNSWKVKWKEWFIAFVLGILASLVAAQIM